MITKKVVYQTIKFFAIVLMVGGMALAGSGIAIASPGGVPGPPAWSHKGGQKGCGNAEVGAPTQTPAYFAAHPDEFAADPDMPPGMRAMLDQIALRQPTVLTSITCTPGPQRKSVVLNSGEAVPNWAGYWTGATSTTYTFVSLDWTVPKVTATSSSSDVSIWPGLGSANSASDALVQAGTAQSSTKTVFWYEIVPGQHEQDTSIPVAPGDSVSVAIGYNTSTSVATFDFYNYTKNTFTVVTEKLLSGDKFLGRQAEWIVERPTIGSSYALLPNFGTVTTTSSGYGTSSTTWMATNANPITMINSSNAVLASPAWIGTTHQFTVTWKKAS